MLTTIFVGCGKDDGNDQNKSLFSTADLKGTWVSGCVNYINGSIIRRYVDDGDGSLRALVHYFADRDCETPKHVSRLTAEYELGDSSEEAAGAYNIDITYSEIEAAYFEESIDEANEESYFGFNDWVAEEYKDVAGLKETPASTALSDKGDVFYTLVKIDGNNRYIGLTTDLEDGTSEDQRPTTVSDDIVLVKQE